LAHEQPAPPYVLLGNGLVALRFLEQMVARASLPRLVVLNAPSKQRLGAELREACRTMSMPVVDWSSDERLRLIETARAEPGLWLLSVYFGHRVDREVLDAVQGRAINVHAAALPWCRGVHTNVWPIIEQCPAGVTIHKMDERIDRGPVLVQTEVPISLADTGATLHGKLEAEALRLLVDSWPARVLDQWPGAQQPDEGSTHTIADFEKLREYVLDDHPESLKFFDLLRARSFAPHPGLTVRFRDQCVRATITLTPCSDA
jgi:methionyl-tRNA formyltransferase